MRTDSTPMTGGDPEADLDPGPLLPMALSSSSSVGSKTRRFFFRGRPECFLSRAKGSVSFGAGQSVCLEGHIKTHMAGCRRSRLQRHFSSSFSRNFEICYRIVSARNLQLLSSIRNGTIPVSVASGDGIDLGGVGHFSIIHFGEGDFSAGTSDMLRVE